MKVKDRIVCDYWTCHKDTELTYDGSFFGYSIRMELCREHFLKMDDIQAEYTKLKNSVTDKQ